MDEKIVKDCISRRQAVYVCLELIHERRKWLSDAGQKEISGIDAAMCAIQDLPSAQPERIRGKWVRGIGEYAKKLMECSECRRTFYYNAEWNFCPNCGAKMEVSE